VEKGRKGVGRKEAEKKRGRGEEEAEKKREVNRWGEKGEGGG
jgi:hypothetical protein